MSAKGIVTEKKDSSDGRKNVVSLSRKGKTLTAEMQYQYADVEKAIGEISAQSDHDLWKAIEEWEFLLAQKTLLRRLTEQKKLRESADIQIIDYLPEHQHAFRALNEEWISAYFKMEAADYKALDDPKGYVLDKGGHILVALYNNEPVGACALLKMDDQYDFELAKMAVSPAVQGKNIGWLLGKAITEKAKAPGAGKIYLESNTRLQPSINLYHKLGFQKVTGRPTSYERCNIQMELSI